MLVKRFEIMGDLKIDLGIISLSMTTVSTIYHKLPGLNELNQEICKIITNNLKDILTNIALEYELDEEELKDKFLNDIVIEPSESNENERKSATRRSRKEIPPESQCMAKVASGKQCRRRKKGEYSEYCGGHTTSRPYGRIDNSKKKKNSPWDDKPTKIDLTEIDTGESTIIEIKDKNYVLYNFQLHEVPEDCEEDEIDLEELTVCADIDEDGNINWLHF